jgi:hypothetical protein
MMDDPNNPMPNDGTQQKQHDEANISMRLAAAEQRVAVCVAKLQQALAIASHLTPKGIRL